MKTLTFILTFFVFLTSGNDLKAQVDVDIHADVRIGNPAYVYSRGHIRKEVRELKQFRRNVDRFIEALTDNDWYRARRIRIRILNDMQDEIHQTQHKLHDARQTGRQYQDYYPEYSKREKYRRNKLFRKKHRQGKRRGHFQSFEERHLRKMLKKQKHAYERLRHQNLGRGRNAWKNSRHAEKWMLRFEDTLVQEINYLKNQRGR